MAKAFKIIALCLVFTSCTIEDIKYTKDVRTGICFATINLGYNNGVMTEVSCTPAVERLIIFQK